VFKSALGILCSLFLVVVSAPLALAADTSATGSASKRHVSKKHLVAKTHKRAHAGKRISASLNSREKLVKHTIVSNGKRRVVYQRVAYIPRASAIPEVLSAGDLAGLNRTRDALALKSNVALVLDESNSEVLFEKNSNVALPIASITKLMTGMVVVESNQDMNEVLEVTEEDVDREKFSSSRLRVGARLTRANMLHIALMSSENRAASALGRNYPGGLPAFVAAMNAKARLLGMDGAHYVDSNGLSSHNVASARDLAKLVIAAREHPILCQYSTDVQTMVEPGGNALQYKNSNHLVGNPAWDIILQKTGYIKEAGRCLVMHARIEGRAIVMVFLDSKTKESRLADAGRIRKWIEALKVETLPHVIPAQS